MLPKEATNFTGSATMNKWSPISNGLSMMLSQKTTFPMLSHSPILCNYFLFSVFSKSHFPLPSQQMTFPLAPAKKRNYQVRTMPASYHQTYCLIFPFASLGSPFLLPSQISQPIKYSFFFYLYLQPLPLYYPFCSAFNIWKPLPTNCPLTSSCMCC